MKARIRAAILAGSAAAALCVLASPLLPSIQAATDDPKPSPLLGPNNADAVCASCHREIYDKYSATTMARGSGAAMSGRLEGQFTHAPSGVSYKVFVRAGEAWMSFQRPAKASPAEGTGKPSASPGDLEGERRLRFFIGSGRHGRTYLYEQDGLWFEAPINFYTRSQTWDMAPNYGASRSMPAALPVDPNCLHCHATAIQPSLPEARNRFAGAPFAQGGIGCAACHGDATEHLRTGGHGAIVNPAKLSAVRRDSVCLQCHLEGDAAVYRAGTSLAAFRPGDDLSAHVNYFVRASAAGGGGRASSQWEALLRSPCKQASGDKLTCTTCHDPHSSPPAAERVAFFRGKCLSCHTGQAMAAEHHPEQQDCASCHMPSRKTTDISHEQAVDHNIQRKPAPLLLRSLSDSSQKTGDLVPVGNQPIADRELGLAYAQIAQHGDQVAGEKAQRLLRKAEKAGAGDAELHTQLGFMDQISGEAQAARKQYLSAIDKDPNALSALGNLAVLEAAAGRTSFAVSLLQRVVNDDPSQTAAGMNLAFIECSVGENQKASDVLALLTRFNPDDPALRLFRTAGSYAGQHCNLRKTGSPDAPR